jgi:hypothetical protein
MLGPFVKNCISGNVKGRVVIAEESNRFGKKDAKIF